MALRPPPLRLLPGASRALGTHRHPRLFDSLHGQTSPPSLPPSLRGLLNRLFLPRQPVASTSETVNPGSEAPPAPQKAPTSTCRIGLPGCPPLGGPPQAELDLAAPEPIPQHEFDQSPPHDWDP